MSDDRRYKGNSNNYQQNYGYQGGPQQGYQQPSYNPQQYQPQYQQQYQQGPPVNAVGTPDPQYYEQIAQAYLQGKQSMCNQPGN